jgi:hypothetical protein
MRSVTARRAGLEADGPHALAGILDQQRLAEGLAVAGQQRVGNLLDAVVDRLDHRDARQGAFPEAHHALADEVGGSEAGDENQQQGDDDADARHVEAQKGLRPDCCRNQQENLVKRIDDPGQHDEGDDQRNPDQQPGNEVFFHSVVLACVGTQWHAQLPPQGVEAGVSALAASVFGLVLPVLLLPPPLKSVAYQPLPFSWKPAAEICFV